MENKEKDTRITVTPPEGYRSVTVIDDKGVTHITFEKEGCRPALPRTWDEFCKSHPIQEGEWYIDTVSEANERGSVGKLRDNLMDRNLLPSRAAAEAMLALCQLIQLRDCYNDGWVPNWKVVNQEKYVIEFYKGNIETDVLTVSSQTPLFFKTEELRNEFLDNFSELIEKLKPLYGIHDYVPKYGKGDMVRSKHNSNLVYYVFNVTDTEGVPQYNVNIYEKGELKNAVLMECRKMDECTEFWDKEAYLTSASTDDLDYIGNK